MFGKYQQEFSLQHDNLTISVQQQAGKWHYERHLDVEPTIKKVIANNAFALNIQPIAPILSPKALTPFLLISLNQEMIVSPFTAQIIYLLVPIEIGCYLMEDNASKDAFLLDHFRLANAKYTLYGTPSEGRICQYCASDIYTEIPENQYLYQAVLKVKMKNQVSKSVKLSKLVIDCRKLTIYLQDKMVCSTIAVNLENKIAISTCLKEPIEDNMSEMPNYITLNQWSLPTANKFVMDYGL